MSAASELMAVGVRDLDDRILPTNVNGVAGIFEPQNLFSVLMMGGGLGGLGWPRRRAEALTEDGWVKGSERGGNSSVSSSMGSFCMLE